MINNHSKDNPYRPITAIMVYHAQQEDNQAYFPIMEEEQRAPEFYIEQHELYKTKQGAYKLGAGTPMEYETIYSIIESINSSTQIKRKFKGLMPDNLLYFYPHMPQERLVWVVEPERRYLKFNRNDLESGKADCPRLIFSIEGNKMLSVFAVKDKKITPETILYNAPFPNVTRGSVCIGGALKWIQETQTYEELMEQWESIFFDSTFNHDGGSQQAKISMGKLWKPLLDTKKKFPLEQLVESGKKLKNLY